MKIPTCLAISTPVIITGTLAVNVEEKIKHAVNFWAQSGYGLADIKFSTCTAVPGHDCHAPDYTSAVWYSVLLFFVKIPDDILE